MGTVADNRTYYAQYDWRYGGAEWSTPWGNTRALWEYTLYPRLARYLPAGVAVEIGAGHGRISKYLLPLCHRRLHLLDIMPGCIDACARLFADEPKVVTTLTDGHSLRDVDDESVDLIVCFYSLVHADAETIAAYAREFRRVLRPDGVVFLHHSNAGIYYQQDQARHDARMRLLNAYRDITMTAAGMRRIAKDHGLRCIRQECVNWDVKEVLSDCFSTIVRTGAKWQGQAGEILNPGFRREMHTAAMGSSSTRWPRSQFGRR
jgi:SAM-dependent methyltransferase